MSGLGVGRYAAGVVALLIVAGSLGFAALVIRRALLADWLGAAARLAEVVIALALLTGLLELLGALGLFQLAPILLASAGVALGISRALPGEAHAGAARAGASVSWIGLAAITAVAAVAGEWAGPTLISYDFGILTFDSLWYHLPWAASFAQSGQITTLHFTDVEYLTAFYPATAELLHGLGIMLLGGDLLSPGINLIWLGLLLLAAYCAGAPFGAGIPTLLGGALAMATPMMLLSQAGSAANDVVGVFFLVAAVALVLSAPERTAVLGLAAIAAGLAISVKLSMLAPVLALTAGVLVWRRCRRVALVWLAPLALTGGFWYLRNVLAVGNPLPWLNLPGLAVPTAPLQAPTAFSVAHYLTSGHFWQAAFQPAVASGLGPWWWAILAAAGVGPLLCLLPGAQARVRLVGAVALASWLAYLVTPESAAGPAGHPLGFAFNLRYSAPALTLSLVATGLAPALRGRRGGVVVAAGMSAVLLATLLHPQLWPARHLIGQLAVGGAVALAALTVSLAPGLTRTRAALAAAAVLAVALCLAGFAGQRSYFRSRFGFQPGISHLSGVWAFFRGVHRARVGIVGTFGGFFAYPLFGVDDSNRVQYIAARGPHGSFTAIGTCPRWRAAVNAAHLRYLVSTPARDPWRPKLLQRSPERAWTAGDPVATVAFQSRTDALYITVFALHGRLDPGRCPRSAG